MEMKGTLILVGGNEDKGLGTNEMYSLDFVKAGILSRIVNESGGPGAQIAVITSASSIPKTVGENYRQAFEALNCKNVHTLDIRKKSEANKKEILRLIEQADCVMFTGGDQSKIVRYISGTNLHHLLHQKLMHGNFIVAGTSAGAMSMSKVMIAGGSVPDAMLKGNVKLAEGMAYLDQLIIDTHFIQRGRFGRLAEAVARFPNLLGIGLAEDTGIIIRNGDNCEVIGSGMVILFDARNLTHNRYAELSLGTPISLSNLTTHVLATGDRFKIKERSLKILPLEEELTKL